MFFASLHDTDCDGYISSSRKLDGVTHIVQEDLLNTKLIANDLRNGLINFSHKMNIVFSGLVLKNVVHILNCRSNIEWCLLNINLICFKFRKVQNVVNQCQQMLA